MKRTVNGSSFWSCSSLINPELKIGLTVSYSFILVVSLVGHFLIVLVVYKTPTLRKPINMLIANMAISDLVGTYISSLVSVRSLVLITVDRFGAVVVPLHYPLITSKQCPFFIVATWIIAMAVHSSYLAVSKLVEYPGGMRCTSQWRENFGANANRNFVLVVAIVFFYTPFVLLAILYSVILIKLKRQAHPGEASANAEEQRTKRIRNVLKMAIAINVVFFICWIPLSSKGMRIIFSAPESSIWSSCSFYLYDRITLSMALANCAINPIICLIFSSSYRQALKETCESQ